MNTLGKKSETPNKSEENLHRWFLNVRILGNNFKICISKRCLRFKIWCQKPNPKPKFGDTNFVYNLQETLNELNITKKPIEEESMQILQNEIENIKRSQRKVQTRLKNQMKR